METLFLEARYNGKIDLNKIKADKLPSRIGLIATVQFAGYLDEIRGFLLKKNRKVFIGKGRQRHMGQVLGCDISSAAKVRDKADAFLYVGSGEFHPLFAAVETGRPVFTFDPAANEFDKVGDDEIIAYKKRKKGALLRFLSSDNIGVLASTKPGQYYDISKLEPLKKKYPKKRFYTFIAETIDYTQLGNFPFVEAWINTACPRIEEDINIINIKEIK